MLYEVKLPVGRSPHAVTVIGNEMITMRIIIKIISISCIASSLCCGQIVTFTDTQLKQYLINEMCVDTTQNGIAFSNDITVDTNGDNEIQISEALAVKALEIYDFPDNYNIKTLSDLSAFSNLNSLKIIDLDSVERISGLDLDSLHTLWIADGQNLRYINISNLPNITSTLRIEGLTTLDTLNIQNGTSANVFSLFYSQNIQFACVDSIANEFNQFYINGAMAPGTSPSVNCGIVGLNESMPLKEQACIYPNPADDYLYIKTPKLGVIAFVFNHVGKKVIQSRKKIIDISMLPSGIYFISCQIGDYSLTNKVVVR